mmetsp:Transcript_663/g.1016  ORF Transcript_663/g.1016 Transcript_663/m.1016 type:complete len:416 (+) Transcript_663:90-1337(+)
MFLDRCHRSTLLILLIFTGSLISSFDAFGVGGIKTRSSLFSPKVSADKPKLVIISGCPGTSKGTFGMSVALDKGIVKCICTDTVRSVMRSFIAPDISPGLHRSSWMPSPEGDDPVQSWRETCAVIDKKLEELIEEALSRGTGLVLEGVSVAPSSKLIKKWEDGGGVAMGCLLTIPDENVHKSILLQRGFITAEERESFDRVRKIQDEMIRLAEENDWLMIEQKVERAPLDAVSDILEERDNNNETVENVTPDPVQKQTAKKEDKVKNDEAVGKPILKEKEEKGADDEYMKVARSNANRVRALFEKDSNARAKPNFVQNFILKEKGSDDEYIKAARSNANRVLIKKDSNAKAKANFVENPISKKKMDNDYKYRNTAMANVLQNRLMFQEFTSEDEALQKYLKPWQMDFSESKDIND